MPELAPDDLPAAVRARFDSDPAAQSAINAVLAAARRYCGWHVSPVREDEVLDLDGPGGRVLSLPTLNLLSVSSVTESGVAVNVADLDRSRRKGTLTKPYGRWTCRDGAIEVTATHGFTEEEAADWRRAVVQLVGQRAQSSRPSADLKRRKVDDVEYEWFEGLVSVDSELAAVFAPFRILPS